ncbi:MAG: radical SAM protein [Planctomycetota bacterium]
MWRRCIGSSPCRELPPSAWAAVCAAVLEAAGYEVKVLDALQQRVGDGALRDWLMRERPDVVGLGIYTPTRFESFRTAQWVRDTLGPDVHIIAGGPHPSAVPEDTLLHVPAIDHLVAGEGEYPMRDLVAALEEGRPVDGIGGVWTRKDGIPVSCGTQGNIQHVDELPFPARHLVHLRSYGTRMPSTMSRCTTMLTSRGCPARCIFCTRDWFSRKTRMHSPEYMLEEIQRIFADHGKQGIIFQDDTFTLSKKRIHALCDLIRARGLKFQWLATTRVDCLDKELMRSMKSAGCRVLTFGAESMNQETLDWLRKGFTVEQVRQAVQWADEIGLTVRCTYLIGIGNETEQDLVHSIAEARKLKVSKLKANVGLSLYPGTPVWPMAIEQGILTPDYSYAAGWQDPEKRYGNGETPRWYTPHVPLARIMELRKQTEVNAFFTRLSPRMVQHRALKVCRRLAKHPIETAKHVAQAARLSVFDTNLHRKARKLDADLETAEPH